jgi:hypothetical protein
VELRFKAPEDLFNQEQLEVIAEFLKFLHNEFPLEDIKLRFVKTQNGTMTTGVRRNNGDVNILAGNRMLIDVLRTLAHEWIHEGQVKLLGWGNGETNIGGPHENQANALAGTYLKEFQAMYPNFKEILYK